MVCDGQAGAQHNAVLRVRCVCSRHVACNMVGSAPSMTGGVGNPTTASVHDGQSGQSDHSGKTTFNFLKFTRPIHTIAQQSIASNVFKWTCHQLRSTFRTTLRMKCNFYCCDYTLAICESMSRLRVVVMVTPEEFSCVLKPFVTSRSWLVYEESAQVSETKLHKRERVETRCSLDCPPRAFTKSRVPTVCCDSGFQARGGPLRVAGPHQRIWWKP